MKAWLAHPDGPALLGEVPPGVTVEVVTDPQAPPSDPAGVTFWTPPYLVSSPEWTAFAGTLPDVRVVQLLTAGADAWLGRIPPTALLCDAQGVHDAPTADWAVTATLAWLRRFDHFARAQGRGEWAHSAHTPTDELTGKRVLVVGAGAIGTKIGARLAPFEVSLTYVARHARPGVHAVAALPALLPAHDVVILVVPLTTATRGLVDDAFLAAMPDGALLVNAARGPVVDTDALVRALSGGRIGAALDVTDPEPLPAGHPLWTLPGVLLTPHVAGAVGGMMRRAYDLVGAQLRRHAAGAPLANVVHGDY
ncbi:phosphoglycerate dehydrogenase [Pilimelia terevasa]|uniref:Phosphoglycerate dehydrogenase n=1 Tax=Pilimelia terevasa TaxID=53372 RepID=A0A8J3BPY7_9ACTN|nr:2-hydroxyacid dehydrogenase [Pilimelia terevasa]GGK19489.1 phosphoglycerate dehydrogenase [Pilimelia terevasa]